MSCMLPVPHVVDACASLLPVALQTHSLEARVYDMDAHAR